MGACAGKQSVEARSVTATETSTDSGSVSPAVKAAFDPRAWSGTQCTSVPLEERYTAVGMLGEGAFGLVRKVSRTADGSVLAAKQLQKPAHGGIAWERALSEVELWKQLSSPFHPAVLTLIEVIETAAGFELITEFMAHGELFDALENIAFTEQTCRMVTLQIASALAHLHLRHKLAHCDVKPANILCCAADPTQCGSLKLADFGFCQRFTRRSAREFTVSCGTLEYFAPELVLNRKSQSASGGGAPVIRYGAQVDCWALGCVVYELLHGEPPYFAPTDDVHQMELILAHELTFPPESFATVSQPAQAFVSGLLAPEPASRLLIEEALRHPWLQPVTSERAREDLQLKLPDGINERRAARKVAHTRLRSATAKIIAMNRLSHGRPLSTSSEGERPTARPPAANSVAPVDDDDCVIITQPSPEALRALEVQMAEHPAAGAPPGRVARRPSEASEACSYHSDEMAPREI